MFSAYVWCIWAERNGKILKRISNPRASVMQKNFQVMTTKILYLGIRLPNSIQRHWNVPSHVHVNHSTLIGERCQGWRLSIVPTRQVLVGILWRDIHQPQHGRIVQMLNYYEGIFQLL